MPQSTPLRDASAQQPELPGARAAASSTFIEAIRRTPCGSLAVKTWLVFLASYCRVLSGSPTGKCWPSLKRLAADSEGTERAVKRHNAQLVALGWLKVEHGIGNRCTYIVRSVDALVARAVPGRDRIVPSEGTESSPQKGQNRPLSRERVLNGQEQPPVRPPRDRGPRRLQHVIEHSRIDRQSRCRTCGAWNPKPDSTCPGPRPTR